MGFQCVSSIWVVGTERFPLEYYCICLSTWKHAASSLCLLVPGKKILRLQTTDVEGVDLDDEDEEGEEDKLRSHLSSSTPNINNIHTAADKQESRDSGVSDDSDIVQKFVRGAKFVCRVIEDFTPTHDQPSCSPLRVSWKTISYHYHYWHCKRIDNWIH